MRLERHGFSEIRFALLSVEGLGGGKGHSGGQASKPCAHSLFVGQFQEPPDSPMRRRNGFHSPRAQPSQLTYARFFFLLIITSSDHTREI